MCPTYDMTAALWFRKTLKDLYGIEAKDNVWFNRPHLRRNRLPTADGV